MAFPIPQGLRAQYLGSFDDEGLAGAEGSLPGGTRMLAAIGFGSRWPGFETAADAADWAVRNLAGFQPWPEYGRAITADGAEPIWWVSYARPQAQAGQGVSPAGLPILWLLIMAALAAVFVLAPQSLKHLWQVIPRTAETIGETMVILAQVLPLLLVGMMAWAFRSLMPRAGPP
jgi:hypothetical protein